MTKTHGYIAAGAVAGLALVIALVYSVVGVSGLKSELTLSNLNIESNSDAIAKNRSNHDTLATYTGVTRNAVNQNTTALNDLGSVVNGIRAEVFGSTSASDSAGVVVYNPGLRDLVRGRKETIVDGTDTLNVNVTGLMTLHTQVSANSKSRKDMATWRRQTEADLQRVAAVVMTGDLTTGRDAFAAYRKAAKSANKADSDIAFVANTTENTDFAEMIGTQIQGATGDLDDRFQEMIGAVNRRVSDNETKIDDLGQAQHDHRSARYKDAHGR
jgi:hypothetical protein